MPNIEKLDKRQLKTLERMHSRETMTHLFRENVSPLINNPAMQLLAFVTAVEVLQKWKVDWRSPIVVPTMSGSEVVYVHDFRPILSEGLGSVLEGAALLSGMITALGKSDVIEKLSKAGQETMSKTGAVVKDIIPLLLTTGALAA